MKVFNNPLSQSFANDPQFGVLKGVKVFVTATNIAGPFAGSLMAEMGAQVLRAEAPNIACTTRGTTACAQLHRNEYSITLSTATKRGQELFKKAIAWADIWIEAGRPGGYDKRGLSDEVCWSINPKLSIVHVSGYGQFGPYKNKASYDVSGQAMGGYMYMNGVSPTSGPLKVNPYLSDYVTAYNACICALAGHIHALKYGEGDSADVAQYDNMFRLLDNYPTVWFNKEMPKNGEPVKLRTGNKHDMSACFSFYDTKDGGAIFVAIVGQGPVERGFPIIGMGKVGEGDIPPKCTGFPLFDPRGAKAEKLLEEFCLARTAKELEEIFEGAGIPCQRAYTPQDIYEDPQFAARENIVKWEDQVFGEMEGIGITNIFKKNPSDIVCAAPLFGEHNREVFALWGLSEEEIDDMYAKGEAAQWSAADTARNKMLKEWGYFWDPDRQCARIGL
ncbi:MAG: CoA transferase [Oscillospiraceae bacterium]|nr:CoA transferase [Oscillospiraceae bacterium]